MGYYKKTIQHIWGSSGALKTVARALLNVTVEKAGGQADPTTTSPINFTVTFSDNVIDFTQAKATLSGTAGATTKVVTGSGKVYNVAVSGMTTSGTVILTIPANGVHNAAGTGNSVSTSADNDVTYNKPLTVTINKKSGQSDPAESSPINFTVVFSDPVTDFANADVTLSGTGGATTKVVTGSGTTYNVAVSGMTADGTVIATLAANVAHNASGTGNNASTSTDNTVSYIDRTRKAPWTKLLLHCEDDTAGWDIFDDSSGVGTRTRISGAGWNRSTSYKKFGIYSGYGNSPNGLRYGGMGDDCKFDDDFTIDFWTYNYYDSVTRPFFDTRNSESGAGVTIWYTVGFKWAVYGSGTFITGNGAAMPQSTWAHIAVVRYNGLVTMYHNGVVYGTPATRATNFSDGNCVLGAAWNIGNGSLYYSGFFDEFRLSKGIARWTAPFTPPVAAYA